MSYWSVRPNDVLEREWGLRYGDRLIAWVNPTYGLNILVPSHLPSHQINTLMKKAREAWVKHGHVAAD